MNVLSEKSKESAIFFGRNGKKSPIFPLGGFSDGGLVMEKSVFNTSDMLVYYEQSFFHIPMTASYNPKDECCPEFDPKPWDEKTFEWKNKTFIKDNVFTFFYMPLNFGSVMKRLNEKVEKANAKMPDWLCLSDHTSKWNMDLYLAVDKEIPDAENVTLSGKFMSKVYEGPYRDTGKWLKDFEEYLTSKNLTSKKTYMWYTTCPKCAKKYGKNYVVIVAEVG